MSFPVFSPYLLYPTCSIFWITPLRAAGQKGLFSSSWIFVSGGRSSAFGSDLGTSSGAESAINRIAAHWRICPWCTMCRLAVQNVNRPRVLGKRHVDLSEVLSRHTNLKSVRTGCGPTCPPFRLCPDHGEKSHGVRKVVGNALVRRAHLLANDRGANVFDEERSACCFCQFLEKLLDHHLSCSID